MWGRQTIKSLRDWKAGNTPTHVGKTCSKKGVRSNEGKHPHACGEDINFCFGQRAGEETPPRMWGRLPQGRHCAPEVRNTPTHVGKTWLSACQTQPIRKHPHACGEDQSRAQSQAVVMETPPRMWGRHQHIVSSGVLKYQIYDSCTPQGFRISINIHQTKKYVPISPPSTCC